MSPTTSTSLIHTPESIVHLFSATLNTNIQRKLFLLDGVYHAVGQMVYRGVYYDRIEAEASAYQITAIVPSHIRHELETGKRYQFMGYLTKQVRKECNISLMFHVMEIKQETQRQIPSDIERQLRIYERKATTGYKPIDQVIRSRLMRGQVVKLAMLLGHRAIVNQDVRSAIGDALSHYDIAEHRVNMAEAEEMIVRLQKIARDQYDLVAIVRGGGSGLEVFNDLNLADAVVRLSTPIVSAIGHTVDKPFIQRIVDKSYDTPTAFGARLRFIAEQVQTTPDAQRTTAKPSPVADNSRQQLEQENDQLRARIQALTSQEQREWSPALIVVLMIMAGIAGALLSLLFLG